MFNHLPLLRHLSVKLYTSSLFVLIAETVKYYFKYLHRIKFTGKLDNDISHLLSYYKYSTIKVIFKKNFINYNIKLVKLSCL